MVFAAYTGAESNRVRFTEVSYSEYLATELAGCLDGIGFHR